jgi:dedicator of cytokinesis protein 3
MEHLTEQKRTAVWRITGDLRGKSVNLLRDMWDQLGTPAREETQIRFGTKLESVHQPGLIVYDATILRDIINIGLVRYPPTQQSAVYILHSIIVGHAVQGSNDSEDWVQLRRDVIGTLDEIFQMRAFRPDHHEKQTFIMQLREAFSQMDSEDVAAAAIANLIDGVDEFVD